MAIRILICDDHPLFRGGLAAAIGALPELEVAGEVGSLAELREALPRGADVVLLDLDLPDGSGLDVVAEVAAADAAVVVVSAHDDVPLVHAAMQRGAIGFIRKDTEPAELLRLVQRAAEGKTALSGEMALRLADALRRDVDERSLDHALAILSPRQREVASLVAEGLTNREIADTLCLSEGTVKNHVTRVLEVVGVPDRTKLAILMARHHLTA